MNKKTLKYFLIAYIENVILIFFFMAYNPILMSQISRDPGILFISRISLVSCLLE